MLTGRPWPDESCSFRAAVTHAVRAVVNHLPIDDEVLYGEIDGVSHIAHVSEIQETVR